MTLVAFGANAEVFRQLLLQDDGYWIDWILDSKVLKLHTVWFNSDELMR